MIKQIAFGLISLLSVASASATSVNTTQTCQISECFSTINIVAVDPQVLKNATKFAWLKPSSSSGSGWSFGSKSKSSDSGSNWFMSVPDKGPVNSKGTVVFYPSKSTFAAYDSMGNLVTSGRASGGMDYCPDEGRACRTPTGTFRVYQKGDASCVSNKYPLGEGGAPMPYCMFFNGGYALHGSYYVPDHPASHGCIRVTPETAAWLHENFIQVGTVIKVNSY